MTNGLVHHRLLTHRPVSWRWMLLLSATDIALISFGVVIGGGFRSFIFLAYYPSLAVFAVVFSSRWLTLAWTTTAAVAYVAVCLVAGPGLDLGAGNEKVLVARLAVMYTNGGGHRFYHLVRTRPVARCGYRGAAAAARTHRTLPDDSRHHRPDRLHDRPGDSPGQESGRSVQPGPNGRSGRDPGAVQIGHVGDGDPIDAGHLLEGRELGRVLWSHCATFEKITGVPTELSQSGTEPSLATETRTRLFSIAHNALTNAFLHARPTRVEVTLSFEADQISLSVSEDGVGLPDGHAQRGRDFNGMRADAERMGGTLTVESARGEGTTVTCVVPHETVDEGV